MGHLPFGYKVVDGCAVIDEVESKQLKDIYQYYFEGMSLINAARKAGLNLQHASVKRMLSNKKYLGTDYYPQIIDKETQNRFLEELDKRADKLGRLERKPKERAIVKIPTQFCFKPSDTSYVDPFEQAQYIYSLIESEE